MRQAKNYSIERYINTFAGSAAWKRGFRRFGHAREFPKIKDGVYQVALPLHSVRYENKINIPCVVFNYVMQPQENVPEKMEFTKHIYIDVPEGFRELLFELKKLGFGVYHLKDFLNVMSSIEYYVFNCQVLIEWDRGMPYIELLKVDKKVLHNLTVHNETPPMNMRNIEKAEEMVREELVQDSFDAPPPIEEVAEKNGSAPIVAAFEETRIIQPSELPPPAIPEEPQTTGNPGEVDIEIGSVIQFNSKAGIREGQVTYEFEDMGKVSVITDTGDEIMVSAADIVAKVR